MSFCVLAETISTVNSTSCRKVGFRVRVGVRVGVDVGDEGLVQGWG